MALLGFLFLATVVASAFVTLKYRYTAIAASMQILLQIHLLAPDGGQLIGERLLDTAIGAVIATLFSFVLPSWEYRALPRLIASMLAASQRYIAASGALFTGASNDDFAYRLARKRFMDTLAGVSSALLRMLDEPASKQRAVEQTSDFIVRNYLLVAHVAAIRLALARHASNLPEAPLRAGIQESWAEVAIFLERAGHDFAANPASAAVTDTDRLVAPALAQPPVPQPLPLSWPAWPRLQQRLRLLRQDAALLAARSAGLAQALRN